MAADGRRGSLHSPPLPPFPQTEFAVSEALTECADPTRDEELAYEASQKKEDEEGEDGEAGEEEEED